LSLSQPSVSQQSPCWRPRRVPPAARGTGRTAAGRRPRCNDSNTRIRRRGGCSSPTRNIDYPTERPRSNASRSFPTALAKKLRAGRDRVSFGFDLLLATFESCSAKVTASTLEPRFFSAASSTVARGYQDATRTPTDSRARSGSTCSKDTFLWVCRQRSARWRAAQLHCEVAKDDGCAVHRGLPLQAASDAGFDHRIVDGPKKSDPSYTWPDRSRSSAWDGVRALIDGYKGVPITSVKDTMRRDATSTIATARRPHPARKTRIEHVISDSRQTQCGQVGVVRTLLIGRNPGVRRQRGRSPDTLNACLAVVERRAAGCSSYWSSRYETAGSTSSGLRFVEI